jgi:hypothetical protein
MKIKIPNLPEWEQIGGDMNIGSHGGILARTDGDALEVVQIQPVRKYVGDGEAQEVGYPFWSKEGWYDLDDLREISQDRMTMGYTGLDDHIDDLTPEQRALALAETAVEAGYKSDEGQSGWADDIDQGFPQDILESLREEDDEFRRDVLGEDDEDDEDEDDFEPNKGLPENPSLRRLSPKARKVVIDYARREGPELGAALALARHDPRSRAVSVWTTSGSGASRRTYRSTVTGGVIDTESSRYPMTNHARKEIEAYEEDLKRWMVQEYPELVEDVARAMSPSMSPNRRKDPHATALANKRWHPRTDPHAAALAHKRWRRMRSNSAGRYDDDYTATIYLSNDVSKLGPDATREDLERYAENLREAAIERFGLDDVVVNIGTIWRTDSDDSDVLEWLRELEAGDGWLVYLD